MKNKKEYYNGTLKNKLKIKDYYELHSIIRNIIDNKIEKIMSEINFDLSVNYVRSIHYQLFKSVYFFSGSFRNVNVVKKEPFLLGYEINFTNYEEIEKNLLTFPHTYKANDDEIIKQIVEKLVILWKTHPFRAGNTITCIIFVCKYVENIYGYNIYSEIKKDYIKFYVTLILASIENEQVELFLFFKEIIDHYEKNVYKLKKWSIPFQLRK